MNIEQNNCDIYMEKLRKITPNLSKSPYPCSYIVEKVKLIVENSSLSEGQKLGAIREILETFEE